MGIPMGLPDRRDAALRRFQASRCHKADLGGPIDPGPLISFSVWWFSRKSPPPPK